MTSIMKWLTRGGRVTPKYRMVDNQLVLSNASDLKKEDITAEVYAQTVRILVAQRKVTLLNRELKLIRIFPENGKQQ